MWTNNQHFSQYYSNLILCSLKEKAKTTGQRWFSSKVLKHQVLDIGKRNHVYKGQLTRPSKSRFSPERTRIETFTEERMRFQIPIQSRWQKPKNIVATQEGLHVLTDSPIGVHSFFNISENGQNQIQGPMKSFMHLDDVLPYHSSNPKLSSLSLLDRLVLFLPSIGMFVIFKPQGGECAVVTLPKRPKPPKKKKSKENGNQKNQNEASDSSFFSSMLGFNSNNASKRHELIPRLHDALSNEGILIVDGGQGSNSFDVLQFGSKSDYPKQTNRVFLPSNLLLLDLKECTKNVWLVTVEDIHKDTTSSGWIMWDMERNEFHYNPIQKRQLSLEEALKSIDSLDNPELAQALTNLTSNARESVAITGMGGQSPKFLHPFAVIQSTDAAALNQNQEIVKNDKKSKKNSKNKNKSKIKSIPRLEPDQKGEWEPLLSQWLPHSKQTISILQQTPEQGKKAGEDDGLIHPGTTRVQVQVVDENSKVLKSIFPIELRTNAENDDQQRESQNDSKSNAPNQSEPLQWIDLCEMADGQVALLQRTGCHGIVRIYQVDSNELEKELAEWKRLLGIPENYDPNNATNTLLSISAQGGDGGLSANPPPVEEPKHGKEDPDNTPHVGGNTWAGGTGGSNTAGLGGRGGPYRLDKGHAVHQVSEEAKRQVDEETQRKARELNRKAFAERLKEIEMSEDEHGRYMGFLSKVEQEVSQLRVILDSLESRNQERTWLKNQGFGELDDSKLVDGVTGEKMIYKRRGVSDPTPGLAEKPKRIRFVLDCSGSMYRFNSTDGRLERQCELVVMLLEALDGFESRFEYSIVGHSGESEEILFVDYGKPPRSRKERLKVCLEMIAHSQFCFSGDMTLEATEAAIEDVAQDDNCDESFVFVVSDANLRRYGITPAQLGRCLVSNPDVNAFAIFIASFGEEAQRIKRELPAGKGHVCLDTADLPMLFREILVTNVIR